MKKTVLSLVFLSIVILSSFGQDEEMQTLLGNKPLKIGGFAGPFMSFTSVDGQFAHMMGGGGCVLLGNFFIGGYGLGMTNKIPYAGNTDNKINFGHGGFWLGYTLMSNKLIHPVIDLKTGWGSIKEKPEFGDEPDKGDNVFVLTPTLELELNVARFFRIAVGANYQATFMVDEGGYSNKDFSSPGLFLSFKFGAF